jgi:hypothetical protein
LAIVVVVLWIVLELATDYGPLGYSQFAGLPLRVWVIFTAPIAGIALLGLVVTGLVHLVRFSHRDTN